jgi:hypothetical protein
MRRAREDQRRALRSLLELDQPLDAVLRRLATFGWDSDEELVTLRPAHVIHVLKTFQDGEYVAGDVERWANAVEGRDDIGLDDEAAPLLKEAIFDLANPSLQGAITPEAASTWIARLATQ